MQGNRQGIIKNWEWSNHSMARMHGKSLSFIARGLLANLVTWSYYTHGIVQMSCTGLSFFVISLDKDIHKRSRILTAVSLITAAEPHLMKKRH